MKEYRRVMLMALIIMLAGMAAACGQQEVPASLTVGTAANQSGNAGGSESVIIENSGRTITFEEAPKRAVSLNQHATEIMLALGLEDSMIGTAYLDDQIHPKYQAAYDKVPVLSDQYPSQEVFLGAEPDFAYAGWKSAFSDKALGSTEHLESMGIKSYIQESSNMNGPTMEDVFRDIKNIGSIFRVEERAEKLVADMEAKIEAVHAKVADIETPARVFVYDSGEKEPFTAAQNFMNEMITLAGGSNIFNEINKGWATVTWEEVVNRNPEIIVIVDYGDTTVEQKKEFLQNYAALQDVTAIKEQRFIVLPLSACAEGIRGPETVETLAKHMYPEKFE
ncbi:Fe3+-hydroxamate ABC transporter substrate-binding protein [Paenibacillus sambharensis]|uniref:Fe3+-hydroxamate ABC transporter substrate-binding protein n=1 Tax=Paenibacillus sambharensis TaxID=1803190 RepID=A0A2W1LQ55_9BACL|nr:ABC transporter substrate-binding protein [Paenibacillus sambharensis]PZD97072.1 Fe3+-hydroxamate ABC transporter substrate-binding protein [Paenibacillus sambharensis]